MSSGRHTDACGQTDRHMTKVIGTFRYYAKWPEKELKLCSCQIFGFIDSVLMIWSGVRLFRCCYCVRFVILVVNFKDADLDFV